MRTLENKIVIITGAGSGFGRTLALELADRKAIPVITDVNADGLAETAGLLEAKGVRYGKYLLDIRSRVAWDGIAAAAEKEFGGIDVLINNAGVMSRAESFLELSEEHCRFIFEVNFWGMYQGIQAVVPYLAKRREAHIVNVASSLALIGTTMASIYCSSKAAIASYTYILREELRGSNIHVTLACPGVARTNLGRNVSANSKEQQELNAKNFDRFATMPPEKVAKKLASAILANRRMVTTGIDGKLQAILQRLAPGFGYWLMATAYRKIADPKLFARLDALKHKP
jgi:short-subunit dehydrogenase